MSESEQQVTIRKLNGDDHESLVWLAQLDSSPVPQGEVLGAVVDGRLVAALSLSSGESVANPFVSSQGVRSMLELRVSHLDGGSHRGSGLRRRVPGRGRARAALPASPPGAGGRLLALARRV
jgi:hypothetical protein